MLWQHILITDLSSHNNGKMKNIATYSPGPEFEISKPDKCWLTLSHSLKSRALMRAENRLIKLTITIVRSKKPKKNLFIWLYVLFLGKNDHSAEITIIFNCKWHVPNHCDSFCFVAPFPCIWGTINSGKDLLGSSIIDLGRSNNRDRQSLCFSVDFCLLES